MKALLRRKPKQEELNLVPMMNLMTVLIPFLLSITAFAKVSTIDINMQPKGNGSNDQTKDTIPPVKDETKIKLSVLVSDQGMTVGAKGGFLPTVFTREQWKFKDEEKNAYYTVQVDSNMLKTMREDRAVNVAAAGREMTIHERQDIMLLATDKQSPEEVGNLVKTVHNTNNDMLVKLDYSPVLKQQLKPGDTLINLTNYIRYQKATAAIDKLEKEINAIDGVAQKDHKEKKLKEFTEMKNAKDRIRYYEIVTTTDALVELPASAFDILMTRLLKVRRDFASASDIDEIIITCEDEMVYDKVVKLIDISRISGFKNIMLGKFRA